LKESDFFLKEKEKIFSELKMGFLFFKRFYTETDWLCRDLNIKEQGLKLINPS
jgi:hypothetical protein